MKNIIKFITFVFILFTFVNCEDKPDKNLYGIPQEDQDQLLQGLLLSYGVVDNRNGTVTDTKTGLTWKKCVQGQVYRSLNNDCQGSTATGTLTTPGDQSRYGATFLSYCNVPGNDCNVSSLPMTLKADTLPGITSEAYNSCANDTTAGITNWRVAAYPELKAIAAVGKVVTIHFFPNTPDDFFWSSWGNEGDGSGATARAISFSFASFGREENISKTTKLFVRCVSNPE